MLRQFLQHILDLKPEEYKSIKLLDTNQRLDPESKLGILDLKIETVSGKMLDVEMQLLPMASLTQRILFYLSQMLVDQLQPGQKYSDLKRVISILIVDHEMFPSDDLLHHCFRFMDKKAGIELSNLMEVNVLELPKARKKTTADCPLDVWLKFLAASTKEEFMEYAAKDSGVNDACVVLKALSADEKMRMEAEDRLKAWRDEMDRLDGARNEGREEGIDIGRNDIALTMLKAGEPLEKIVAYTKLTLDAIHRLEGGIS